MITGTLIKPQASAEETQIKNMETGRMPVQRPMTRTQAARVLRVSREHLSRVLNGKVRSRRLRGLYNELIQQETKKKHKQ